MTRYGHIVWRVIAVVAFAGTAALAVMLTRAPVRDHVALSSRFTGSRCAASGLQARLGPDAPAPSRAVRFGGGTSYTLEFTNVSARPCHLYGFPDVSAYAGGLAAGAQMAGGQVAGVQVGGVAARDMSVRPRPVLLVPGATARSVLRVARTGGAGRGACGQVIVRVLRVVLPDQGRPVFVPARFPACSRRGLAFMSVQAFQARGGVPG